MGTEIRRIEVRGWELATVSGERTPRVGHREVARRLGYSDAKDLIALADRVFGEDWKLRAQVAEFREGSRGPAMREYFFSRNEVVRLAMRSEAPNADAIQEEIAQVYEAWLDGALLPAAAPTLDPVLARILEGQNRIAEQLAGGVTAAQATATRAEEKADHAAAAAKEARDLANQAVLLAGSKGLLDAISDSTAPGRATETPDGAVVRKAPDGYKAMRAVARDYSLPRSGEGASLVSRIAEALGIFDDPKFYFVQDVVIGGRVKNQHRMYSPAALELLDKPLRAAQGVMVGLGYVATTGGAMRPIRTGTKSRKWTVAQMYDAAIATSAPPPDGQQGSLFEKAS